jgi:hypothetical protein
MLGGLGYAIAPFVEMMATWLFDDLGRRWLSLPYRTAGQASSSTHTICCSTLSHSVNVKANVSDANVISHANRNDPE